MQTQAENENNAIDAAIWRVPRDSYPSAASYEAHVIDQYKLAVEMADRISARRMIANTFFVTIHTAAVAAFAGVMLLCLLWQQIITSYKQLNAAKFTIIGRIEERLPISIYGSEWKLVGEGRNRKLYFPTTHIEQWVPWAFIIIYACLAYVVLTK